MEGVRRKRIPTPGFHISPEDSNKTYQPLACRPIARLENSNEPRSTPSHLLEACIDREGNIIKGVFESLVFYANRDARGVR